MKPFPIAAIALAALVFAVYVPNVSSFSSKSRVPTVQIKLVCDGPRFVQMSTSPSRTSLQASTVSIPKNPKVVRSALVKKLKIGSLFGLWYLFNIGYNIYNKKVLNVIPQLTYSVAFLQLFIGILYPLGTVWIYAFAHSVI